MPKLLILARRGAPTPRCRSITSLEQGMKGDAMTTNDRPAGIERELAGALDELYAALQRAN